MVCFSVFEEQLSFFQPPLVLDFVKYPHPLVYGVERECLMEDPFPIPFFDPPKTWKLWSQDGGW